MAVVSKGSLGYGLNGPLGGILFRTYGGNTYASSMPTFSKKSRRGSALQTFHRDRFKEATAYAHGAMRDVVKKAYYWQKAKQLKLPNAYTAAITEYMRKTSVEKVDTRKYTGKAGDRIGIIARKKDFNNIEVVDVTLFNAGGEVIECGHADKKGAVDWVYTVTGTHRRCEKVVVRLRDRTGQVEVFTVEG